MAMERAHTVEEFDEFVERPENRDKLFEYIGGEIVEVPSNPYSSFTAMLILAPMMTFVRKHKLGYVTGEAGGYEVDGERYAPDVAFISTKPVQTGYNPTPPELAVEVLSPSDSPSDLAKKIEHYLRAGTVVWAVYPEESKVRVHVPGKPVQLLGMEDVLDASPIIPGFRLPVREIFPED